MNYKRDKVTATLRTEEVAALLGLSARRVCELAAAGILPSIRPQGRRRWVFLRSAVAKYMGVSVNEMFEEKL